MDIIQVVVIGIVATIVIVILRSVMPQFAVYVSIVAGIVIFMMIAGKLSSVLDYLDSLNGKFGIDFIYLDVMLKIIGISYIAEFGSEICRDAGEGAVASKIELAGKVIIFVLAVPILSSLLQMVLSLLP
ncbi:MAG: stage III sporulation protein AD [Eubacteriales bacterium]|nr:stage III sporulation protein AD [Eubacteriales bacterium]